MTDLKLITGILLQGLINNGANHEDVPQQDREMMVTNAKGWATELLSSFEQSRGYFLHVDNIRLFPDDKVIKTIEEQSFLSFKDAKEYVDAIPQHQQIDSKELQKSLFIVEVTHHYYAQRYFRIDGYEIFPSLHYWLRLCRFRHEEDRVRYAFHFDDLSLMDGNATFIDDIENIENKRFEEKKDAVTCLQELMQHYNFTAEHYQETIYIIQLLQRGIPQSCREEERMTEQVFNVNGSLIAPKFQSSVRFADPQ